MSKLDELDLGNDEIEIPEDVPEQGGAFFPLPQPATYVFQLPDAMEEVWNKFHSDSLGGDRITAAFDRENPLTILSSPGGTNDHQPMATVRVNNAERARGREKVLVSDMYYLIQALYAGEDMPKLKNNTDFAKALIAKAGASFKADVEWSARCSEDRDMYVMGDDGNAVQVEGTPGCGKSFYTNTSDASLRIPKDEDGLFCERFECAFTGCDGGAVLRAFPRLTRFKSAK